MWNDDWQDSIWSTIEKRWDIIIIGGGITGAGILREATRLGLEVLLVEQADFAWGTSSRSSKLVHGGLRYLKEGQIRLTRDAVQEREKLLRDGPGLIEPIDFLLATYDGEHPGRLVFSAGLTLYDLLALRWSHQYYTAQDFKFMAGQLTQEGLEGGFRYGDAQTDDARLVLRVLREAVADGGSALNYTRVEKLLKNDNGRIDGILLHDLEKDRFAETRAEVIVNATGAWADQLRISAGKEARIRPLRGSHLIFPAWRLPVAQAVSFLHPVDQRPVFILPWEEVTIVGTTDEDFAESLDDEPSITGREVAYLMAAVEARYPSLGLTTNDVLSTFAGIRPVIGSGKTDSSKESRDHVVWSEDGLITVTGGKLTTFRLIAHEVLEEVRQQLPNLPQIDVDTPIFDTVDEQRLDTFAVSQTDLRRLVGRYGNEAYELLGAAKPGELETIPQTNILWAELRWAARVEGVIHLDDLLLRRVRLGLVIEQGGMPRLERIRAICQPELGWDDGRWEREVTAYRQLWNRCYSLQAGSKIPDWRGWLVDAPELPSVTVRKRNVVRTTRGVWRTSLLVFLTSIGLFLAWQHLRHKYRRTSA